MRSYGAISTDQEEQKLGHPARGGQGRAVAAGLAGACLAAALALVAWQGAASPSTLVGWSGRSGMLVERPVVPVVYYPGAWAREQERPVSEADRLRAAYGQAQIMHVFSRHDARLSSLNGTANGSVNGSAGAPPEPAAAVEHTEEGGHGLHDDSDGGLGGDELDGAKPEFQDESDCPEAEPNCHKVDLGFNLNKWHIGVDFHISSWPWEAIEKAQQEHGQR